jgi:hypothetical protein
MPTNVEGCSTLSSTGPYRSRFQTALIRALSLQANPSLHANHRQFDTDDQARGGTVNRVQQHKATLRMLSKMSKLWEALARFGFPMPLSASA